MADIYVKMSGEGDDPLTKCREARRRRIEMRRLVPAPAPGDSPLRSESPGRFGKRREAEPSDFVAVEKRHRTEEADRTPPLASTSSSSSSSGGGAEVPSPEIASVSDLAEDPPPAFGSVSLAGRSREMEDAVSVRPGFFTPTGGSPLHFFAVFDGHGGSHVSTLCKERMHAILAEELTRAAPDEEGELWSAAVKRCFMRMDEAALVACVCGHVGDPPCGCDRSGIESEIVGSTAVAAVVGPDRFLVANCGDSRAVLSRGGRVALLSDDHKPDRPDELARIEAAGGRVIYLNGARVQGILAMSRALGDKYLKPVVISEPEITIMDRHPEDECLIIASDGLWDVLSNELACDVARRCLKEVSSTRDTSRDLCARANECNVTAGGEGEGEPSESRCSLAAALLARLALGRKSADNISVIVIDLRRT